MAVDFNSVESIIGGFTKVLSLSGVGSPPTVPTVLILVGVPRRPGLSPTKIASRIIARKVEAGIPVGALPSGAVSPEELMWRIVAEEFVKAFQQESKNNSGNSLRYTNSGIRNRTKWTSYGIWHNNKTLYWVWSNTIMKDLTEYTPTELLKLINDTKAEHEKLKGKIKEDTFALDELEKSLNEKIDKLTELERLYVSIIEEFEKRKNATE